MTKNYDLNSTSDNSVAIEIELDELIPSANQCNLSCTIIESSTNSEYNKKKNKFILFNTLVNISCEARKKENIAFNLPSNEKIPATTFLSSDKPNLLDQNLKNISQNKLLDISTNNVN